MNVGFISEWAGFRAKLTSLICSDTLEYVIFCDIETVFIIGIIF